MNRRGFLSALLGTGAAMMLDPERLLWVPGAKTISIPAPSCSFPENFNEVLRFQAQIISDLIDQVYGRCVTLNIHGEDGRLVEIKRGDGNVRHRAMIQS